jgi:Fic family protein/DNA-binding Xre family transcriptional regulator
MTKLVMTKIGMKTSIQQKLQEKGIKIHELAKHLGIDASLMSRILANKRKPNDLQIKKISEVLDLPYSELLTYYLSSEVVKIVKDYPQLAQSILVMAEARVSYLLSDDRFENTPIDAVLQEKLNELEALSKRWRTIKPLDAIQLEKLQEYFHTAYTYESNRIEGNTLSLQETHLVVNEGITIGGKSVREHLEAINHGEAVALLHDLVSNEVSFNEYRLKQIHHLVLKGIDERNAGKYRNTQVMISGSEHIPPAPYMLDKLMEDYFIYYEQNRTRLHPVLLAAEMHERLVTIHPFIDGNGRTSRLVMNFILLQNGYTIANLKGKLKDRLAYYAALQKVQLNHDNTDFHTLIVDHALASLKEHLLLAGESNYFYATFYESVNKDFS